MENKLIKEQNSLQSEEPSLKPKHKKDIHKNRLKVQHDSIDKINKWEKRGWTNKNQAISKKD